MFTAHRLIARVSGEYERWSYNTAVAAFMEFSNLLLKQGKTDFAIDSLLLLMAPMAPHITAELWERRHPGEHVHEQSWPEADPVMAAEETVEMVVQVNGKKRDVINVKPSRVGGLRVARQIVDECAGAGIDAWVGGMLDLGINRAVNLAVAALDGCTLPGDISATDRYFERDITEPFVLDGTGAISVPTGPGLGIDVDIEAVAAYTVAHLTLR